MTTTLNDIDIINIVYIAYECHLYIKYLNSFGFFHSSSFTPIQCITEPFDTNSFMIVRSN